MSGPADTPFSYPTVLPATAPLLAGRSRGAWLRLLLPAALGVAADLGAKAYAFPDPIAPFGNLPNGRHPFEPSIPLIPKVLGFITTINHGAVFGLGQGYGALFVLFSFLAMAVILYVFMRSRANQYVLHGALGLITAGAIGNLYDRLVFGVVRDFLRFETPYFPFIFNIADSLLCIGVPLLMICWLWTPEGASNTTAAGTRK